MLLVGLTGGIGAGKSTVARMLRDRGAIVFDADELARRAVSPGTPGHDAVLRRFGPEVAAPNGDIDRRRLAEVVFTDDDARRDLESIVHPQVFRLLMEELKPHRDSDRVVVFDAPLVVETGFQAACDVVVVVAASSELRIRRVASGRGLHEGDARRRMAAQAPREDLESVADVVIENDGSLEDLERKVEELWTDLRSRGVTAAGE